MRLAAHEAGNGGGCLFDLGLCDARVAGAFGFDGGAGHAVADVLFEQVQGDGVERLGDRGNLGEDVDAVLIFIDHAGDAANLPFDAAQALEVRLFVGGVTVLGFGGLAAAACAGVRLSGFLAGFFGGCAGCGADLGGCAVAALVASGFHDSSIYPRGVSFKVNLRYNLHNLYEFYFYYKDVCFSFVFDVEVIMVSKNGKIADFLKIQKILLVSVVTLIFIVVSVVLSLRGTSESNIWAILSGLAAIISSILAIATVVKRNRSKWLISTPLVLATGSLIFYLYFSGREESVVWGIVSGVFGIISVIISIFQGKDVELEREKKIERRKSRYLAAKNNLNSGDTSIKKEAVRELLTNSAQWMSDDKCMPEEKGREIQNIIDTLCDYIKSHCDLKNAHEVEGEKSTRKLIIDEISNHLSRDISDGASWSGYNFDFSGSQIFYPFHWKNVKVSGNIGFNDIELHNTLKIDDAEILNQGFLISVKNFSGEIIINNSYFESEFKLKGFENKNINNPGGIRISKCNFDGRFVLEDCKFAKNEIESAGTSVKILDKCEFRGGVLIANCYFSYFVFDARCVDDGEEWSPWVYSRKSVFFREVHFVGNAIFNNSEFDANIEFLHCKFMQIISFNSVEFYMDALMVTLDGNYSLDNPDFENARFVADGVSEMTFSPKYEKYRVEVLDARGKKVRLPYLACSYDRDKDYVTAPAR